METKEMTKERADFHVHYSVHDPEATKRIIDEAAGKNVVVLGLVGRLAVSDVLPEIIEYGRKKGVKVLPAAEYPGLVTLEDGKTQAVDLIAIDFDYQNKEIRKLFSPLENRERNAKIAQNQKEFLEREGFLFDSLQDSEKRILSRLLEGRLDEKAIEFCRLVVKNKLNEEKLRSLKEEKREDWEFVARNWGKQPFYQNSAELDAKFLWYLYFRPPHGEGFKAQGGASAELQLKPATELVAAVHKAGGVILYSPEGKFKREIWEHLKSVGIDGIMAWHGSRMELNRNTIREIRKEGYLILGGSDYDPKKNEWIIGVGKKPFEMFISPRRAGELEKYKQDKKSAVQK